MEKSKKITFRVSDEEHRKICELAKERDLSVSCYVMQCALATNGLTKAAKQTAYWHLCKIKDMAIRIAGEDEIVKECDALWQFLK